MIADEEMQKALETVKKYCDERDCLECSFCCICEESFENSDTPRNWNIESDKDED